MKRTIILGVLVLFCCLGRGVTSAQDQAGVVKGRISDTSNGAIEAVRIVLVWDPSGFDTGIRTNVGSSTDIRGVTAKDGTFSMSVPPGFYDLLITTASFEPVARKIRVKSGETVDASMKLRLSDIVLKELGGVRF